MSESNTPGVYVKGDDARVASTPARAVALSFAGYKLQADAPVVEPVEESTPADPAASVEVAQVDEAPKAVEAPKPTPPKSKDRDQS